MARWRVGPEHGRTLYLEDQLVGLLDDARLARVVIEGLALLDELPEGPLSDGLRARIDVWRLRLEGLKRRHLAFPGVARGRPR